MPLVGNVYQSRLLNAADLQPLNRRRNAIIHSAVVESVGFGKDAKEMILLELVSSTGQPWPKALPLNVTNARLLASLLGDNTDHWIGRTIEIWSENTMFAGRVVPGVKVGVAGNGQTALAAPEQPPPQQPSPHSQLPVMPDRDSTLDDEIPF